MTMKYQSEKEESSFKKLQTHFKSKEPLNNEAIESITYQCSKMDKVRYSLRDHLKQLCLSIFGCCKRDSKKMAKERKTPVEIFNEGKDMVESYFDIVTMARLFREMQVFVSTVLTHRQRLLLMFQRKLSINELGSAFPVPEYDEELLEIRRKVLSKDPEEQAEGLEEMKNILEGYKDADELDKIDMKLIAGVYEDDPFAMGEPF